MAKQQSRMGSRLSQTFAPMLEWQSLLQEYALTWVCCCASAQQQSLVDRNVGMHLS